MSAEMIVKVESFKEIAGVDYDYKIGKAILDEFIISAEFNFLT